MIAAPIPADDAARLAELHALNLLDTPPEERFDRITRLLTLTLRVPMAFLTLVDTDRQWFKASCGLGLVSTPRAVSFCGHAILADEAMVVPDAAEDGRFRDSPLVLGPPHIRFYAGQPLHGPGGQRVGSLCIADRRPRTPTAEDLAVLAELAGVVERELGLMEVAHLQRDLIAGQRLRLRELAQAERYVRSLLPAPIDGPIRARWRFEPSSQLGGDFLGYDWIDDDHFAAYLLDVSGHGVGAALLSASAASALRARSLPDVDFRDPSAVLARLNDAFPMGRHDDRYFTIWYGVYDRARRRLTYSSGGHPPALLFGDGGGPPVELATGGPAVGMLTGPTFPVAAIDVAPGDRLCVFSDGAYEIHRPDGSLMTRADLADLLADGADPDEALRRLREVAGPGPLLDDFSMLEVRFA